MHTAKRARLKLARAARHIEELKALAQAFLASRPFEVYPTEAENGDEVHRLRIVKEVPEEWALVVGDAIHNLRSSLDLLAWQMVEASGGTPSQNTAFPISKSGKSAFERLLQRCLEGANSEACRFIRRLRPWTGGNHTLARLHKLDIVDKHHLLLVVGTTSWQITTRMKFQLPSGETLSSPPITINGKPPTTVLRTGDEVFRIGALARSSPSVAEHMVLFHLALGDEDELHPLDAVERMHFHVSRIVDVAEKRIL